MNHTRLNTRLLQRDGMEMMVMAVEMVMVMIPMKSSWMAVTMATISPSGREFPRQISVCRRAFLSLWFSASQRWQNISVVSLPCLGLSGDDICEGTLSDAGQGLHTMPRRGLGLARAWGWCGPPVAPLRFSFWLPGSSDDI